MAELETVIEKKLIDQLCSGESQWTYRPDIRTEEQLWDNFKYILEQNNKAKLNDTPLSESEFAKIKNDISHASFYDAAKWLAGENGKVYVHVQRGNEQLHLLVMNNEHIAGGTSVYEVINQYQASQKEKYSDERNRRFDVTLLINGIPLIHIELKNSNHSYKEGYNQIKKYIEEGKFRGIYSNVQMFVVSNSVDTKYFAAARSTELNPKFITGWLDKENQPICEYIDFAKAVLRIPMAHEIVSKYIVLDNDKKKLLILRPYQIHAIEAMRSASREGKSGYIWHTTGSGKTMTSYKATRNLLMDIPSIEKAIFLIDRKDLDAQTTMAFQSYANNDAIDVDDTENVTMLMKKLLNGDRQMIVTTRQKMQWLINKRLKEGSKEYEKIRNLKVAFVVDECHRAVTPETKRKIEQFFSRSLWYGFTGTPIFEENCYEQKGDLPRTTKQMYGECLHNYTIKEAIHDEAVLGFMVENMGPNGDPDDKEKFETEKHMTEVLNVILNHSQSKFGLQNGKGNTYGAILTVKSIQRAQEYYKLLKKIKEGQNELKIDENIKKVLPDFPKFAITYSLTENEEISKVNQDEMKQSLKDYNNMFHTSYRIDGIKAYNSNLNDRLARKDNKYLNREEQLDIVIVVDRLLTGFDAPCLSTLFMDRQPMSPQNIIQAFSRTNRLYDKNKQYGQIVTFQSPTKFKEEIDHALMLYSREGNGNPLAENWDSAEKEFRASVNAVHALARTPEEIRALSDKQKRAFIHLFRALDKGFSHIKAFTCYDEKGKPILEELDFSEKEYDMYVGMYRNIMSELPSDPGGEEGDEPIMDDYELVAYNKLKIDFDYIVQLLQGFVDSMHPENDTKQEEFERKLHQLREIIDEFSKTNARLGELLNRILDEIIADREKFIGQDMSIIINQMREEAIDKEVDVFSKKWFIDPVDVKYEVYNYRDGVIANENNLKEKVDYASYKINVENPLPKFKFRKEMIIDFKNDLMAKVGALINR